MSSTPKTRILFVDDDPLVLRMLQLAVELLNGEWETDFVKSGTEALTRMSEQPYDAIVTDMCMPGMSGAELLNEVMRRHPSTIRLILSSFADEETVLLCVGAAHQFLSKPFRLEQLQASLDRIHLLRTRIANPEIRALVTKKGSLPSIPAVYFEILAALQNPDCPAHDIGDIVAKDPALTTKLLQLVNSAFFGFAEDVSSPNDAVMLLGVGTIRSLALTTQLFSAFSTKNFKNSPLQRVWTHSMRVGQLAKRIAQLETGNQEIMEEAFTAGTLHDVGKLILAENLPEVYSGIVVRAREQQRPLTELEQETLHATHAEAGAYLLDLWGLPTPLVEAVALHHEPARSASQEFSPLTAVHVGNILEHEENAADLKDNHGSVPQLDTEYLTRLGLADRFDAWRAELATH
jgi:putative nucleotidyltransferase with HDIG domain